jgi:4-amino-4-deoxy-L-arabinose transferase-like glycosyltransferase
MTDAPQDSTKARHRGMVALAVIATFVAVALPFAIWHVTSNSDEARYTVAAARMIATGDYVIPYAAWGEVRLLKPPLTYYYIVAGFALMGQSVFAVKSLWILTAAVVLGLTWALARGIGASRTGALVSVTALASSFLFYQGALIHNPDMPLVLGVAVALLGFLRLISDDDPPAWAPWAAWLGVSWAFLAKGLLVLVLVALALGMRAWVGRLARVRGEVAAVVVAVLASGWWWVVVALREPQALVAQFFGDQVVDKVAFDAAATAGEFAGLMGFWVLAFLPVLIAAFPLRGLVRPRMSAGVALLLVWAGVVTVAFSFSNFVVPRYLLPAMPGVAAVIGLAFSGLDAPALARRAGRSVRVLLLFTLAVALLSAAIVYGGASVLAALGALVLGLGVIAAVWWLAGRGRLWIALPLMVAVLPGTVLLTVPAARVIAFPAAADLGVAAVREAGLPAEAVVVFGNWRLLDRVGLRAPPIEGYRYADAFREDMLEGAGLVLTTTAADAVRLDAMGWRVRSATGAPEDFGAEDLRQAILRRDIAGLREAFGERIYIATPGAAD